MDIFFKTEGLTLQQKKEILEEAYKVNTKWWVDKLEVSFSWSRKRVDMPFNEILEKLRSNSHFVIIHRNSIIDGEYAEIGFRTMAMTDVDYFLWIYINLEDLYKIVKRYKLERL